MKPAEKKPENVFCLIDRQSGKAVGGALFDSAAHARSAHRRGMFQDTGIYGVVEYRVTYELIDPDVAE